MLLLLLFGDGGDELLWHHDVLGHEGLRLLALLLLQVANEVVVEVCLAGLLQRLEQEVLILDHELLYLGFIEALMLELALVDLADAGAVEVLAGEAGEVVRKRALGWPTMAVACHSKFAQLIDLVGL